MTAPATRSGIADRHAGKAPVVVAGAVLAVGAVVAVWTQMGPGGRSLIDLSVYRAGGRVILHGASLYGSSLRAQLGVPLPFTYPPVAAVLTTVLAPLPNLVGDWLWELGGVGVVAACVAVAFGPLAAPLGRWRWPGLAAVAIACLWLTPVKDHLGFGQIDLFLVGLCLADCTARRPRWPRGCLVGLATAVKLVPGVFIVYLALTRRTRAAGVGVATLAGLSALGWLVDPADSKSFWLTRIFQPQHTGNNAYFSNQSIKGMLARLGIHHALLWLALVAVVAVVGLVRARRASLGGQELAGVVLTGLVGLLASPVSWIHSAVWMVPALGVLVGRGRDRLRVAGAVALAVLLAARLPYVGAAIRHGAWSWAGQLLEDSYGLACLLVVVVLPTGRSGEACEQRGQRIPTMWPTAGPHPPIPATKEHQHAFQSSRTFGDPGSHSQPGDLGGSLRLEQDRGQRLE